MAVGKFKWFDTEKRFGFITPEGATKKSDDVFVHISEIEFEVNGDLAGLAVDFDITQGKRGPQASNVRKI